MLLSMKKFTVSCRVLFVLCLAVLAASCSDDDSDPTVVKSSAKAITSFKFATPEATGVITEADKKIAVSVPFGTNVTELVPTIVVSEKATVAPNTGVKQNFTSAVTYTVTAEDGTKQAYVVTVTVGADDEEPGDKVTVTAISATDLEAGTEFYFTGTNFGPYAESEVILTKLGTSTPISGGARDNSTATRLYFKLPKSFPGGEYSVVVKSNGQSVSLSQTITVTAAAPVISSISVQQVDNGGEVTITGENFSATGNTVYLIQDGAQYPMDIVEESETSITFIADAYLGRYTVMVRNSNDAEGESTQEIVVGKIPEVTAINKTSFAKGEQIIITGVNLKSESTSGIFYFWPETGMAFQRVVTVNAEGTQMSYTIPTSFTSGTYDMDVQVDFETIKTYTITIQ